MQVTRPCAQCLSVLLLIPAMSGCGDAVRVFPVSGKVTFEGKPLRGGGSIAFMPLTNQAGKAAGGEIAEDGTYRLTTYKQGDGSMTGEFRVVIHQVVEREPEATPDGKRAPRPIPAVPVAERIPAIYSDAQKSPLTAKVEPKDPNEINFDLKRAG
jgi:hypothetical protein